MSIRTKLVQPWAQAGKRVAKLERRAAEACRLAACGWRTRAPNLRVLEEQAQSLNQQLLEARDALDAMRARSS